MTSASRSIRTFNLPLRRSFYGTRQVPLCWSELVCSVSGYSLMSLVSVPYGHVEGTDTLHLLVTLCVQNTPAVSGTVAHLGPGLLRICSDRLPSGPPRRGPPGKN